MCRRSGRVDPEERARSAGQRDWLQSAGHWRAIQSGKRNMSNRVILITGGNGGLGQAIARAFLSEAAENIVWLGVRQHRSRAEMLTGEFAGRCRCIDLEVTQPGGWK